MGSISKKTTSMTLQIINNDDAPEVFVSDAVGLVYSLGNVHVTFASLKADHSQETPMQRHVNLRLVIPAASAKCFAEELLSHVKLNEAQPVGRVQ